jgi:hypothetical protein
MRPNGLALAPKQKFLFHVYFNTSDPQQMTKTDDPGLVGALVKSVQLPTFRLDTKEYIQYNRKRLVHNRISYEPVTLKMHDDGEGHVLNMWQRYYQYYFADSTYDYRDGKVDFTTRDLYNTTRLHQPQGWGKTVKSFNNTTAIKPAFFRDIQIYGFNRGGFVLYTLINPVITSWQHDTYDYAQGDGVMEHTATLMYESVKYLDSATLGDDAENVPGFAKSSRYDTEPGALGPGSTASTFGQGGLTDTVGAITNDLSQGNILGAAQKVGTSATTFGSFENLKNVVGTDLISAGSGGILEAIGTPPSRLMNFPVPGENDRVSNQITATPRKPDE